MNKVFIFVLGAAAGSLVTWKIVEKKYKQLADEEIESVREYYENKEEQERVAAEEVIKELKDEQKIKDEGFKKQINEQFSEYKDQIKDLGYANNEEVEDDECIVVTPQAVDYIAPYIIAPEEFGEAYNHITKSWTYYADFVLTDEEGDIVFEPEKIIGDALEHFGDYEDDSVHVRNDNLEWDIEIIKHEKTFEELNGEDS